MKFNVGNYWNERYKTGRDSGVGSYGAEVERKIELLRDLVNGCYPAAKTILDVGCGDFNLGSKLLPYLSKDIEYLGLDLSQEIVDRNTKEYGTDKIKFKKIDEVGVFDDRADVVICMDVLFHIIDQGEYNKMLDTLSKSYDQYLVVSQMGGIEKVAEWAPHVRPRRLKAWSQGESDILGTLAYRDVIFLPGEVTTKDVMFYEPTGTDK